MEVLMGEYRHPIPQKDVVKADIETELKNEVILITDLGPPLLTLKAF